MDGKPPHPRARAGAPRGGPAEHGAARCPTLRPQGIGLPRRGQLDVARAMQSRQQSATDHVAQDAVRLDPVPGLAKSVRQRPPGGSRVRRNHAPDEGDVRGACCARAGNAAEPSQTMWAPRLCLWISSAVLLTTIGRRLMIPGRSNPIMHAHRKDTGPPTR
jgi:hypothetical protein